MNQDPMSAAVAALWVQVGPGQLTAARELEAAAIRAEDEPRDTAAWEVVRDRAHRLAGTLGSFGQREAGAIALDLEDAVEGTVAPDASLRSRARELATRLRATLEASL